jgi:hypothetical protein
VSRWTSGDRPQEPICPGCRESLLGNLQIGRLDAQDVDQAQDVTRVSVIFCRSCGVSLHIEPLRLVTPSGGVPVAEPADSTTLDGLFQLQCRDLIDQIRSLGFDPYIWVDMVNDLGATTAAKTILATKMPLVATRWLIENGRPELTLEHEITNVRWADLFDDEDRSEAERRLLNL